MGRVDSWPGIAGIEESGMGNWIPRALVLLAFVGLLTGCGSSGGGPSAPPIAITSSVTSTSGPLIVSEGSTIAFSATVNGQPSSNIIWTVLEGPAGGTITAGGTYTSPQGTGTFHVVAANAANPSQFAEAEVVVVPSSVSLTVSPSTTYLLSGETQQFNAQVAGTTNTSVTFAVEETGGGAVSSTGLYTTPATTGTFHVVVTSVADPHRTAVVTITIIPATISPAQISMGPGGTETFTASFPGLPDPTVDYSVQEGANGGTISSSGVYKADNHVGPFHILAASPSYPAIHVSASVFITYSSGITVTVSPPTANIFRGGVQAFTAVVGNSINQSVKWSVVETGGGSIDQQGNYTAPAVAGVYHVKAVSLVDPSSSGEAAVNVQGISVVLSVTPSTVVTNTNPLTATVGPQEQITVNAAVLGSSNQGVTYSVKSGGVGGTITQAGVYTAASKAGQDTVVVASKADPTKQASLIVQVQSGSGTVIVE